MNAIATHPSNIPLLEKAFEKEHGRDRISMRFKVYADEYLEPSRWTGKWLVEGNEFFSYWDGKGQPPSWAIYCGFVKKEMAPVWYAIQEPRSFLFTHGF